MGFKFNPLTSSFDLVQNTAASVGAPALVNPSTDHAIVRFDGTAGLQQDSGVTIDDSDNLTVPGTISGDNQDARRYALFTS